MANPLVIIDGVRYVPEAAGPDQTTSGAEQVLLLVTVHVYGGGLDAAMAALEAHNGTFDAPSGAEVEIIRVQPGSPP